MLKVSIPLNVLSFKVSYPRAAYSDGSVETVDNLHHRIQCSRELPSGDEFLLVFITKYLFDLGWMLAMENKSLFVFCVHVPAQGPPGLGTHQSRKTFQIVVHLHVCLDAA